MYSSPIRLPGQITGWDIAEDCRHSNPDIPVVYATAHSHVHPRPVLGSVWLQKPYQPHQIVDVVPKAKPLGLSAQSPGRKAADRGKRNNTRAGDRRCTANRSERGITLLDG